jgi:subtilisin family serine protease
MRQYKAQGTVRTGSVAATRPVPDDPLYRVQPDAREWKLDALHRIATGRNVRVAIIDSAIELGHPDLAGQVMLSENFAPGPVPAAEVHGTGVAGIIAAVGGNGKGIVGVAPRARLMGLRACRQTEDAAVTLCDSLSLAKAIYFAVDHKAEVINMSLSGPPDPLLARLIDMAETHGITVVGAVDRSLPGGGFPASHAGVVAVVDEADEAAAAGIYGAPGRDIPTTQPGGNWFFVNGSSYAAAHVSGLFALMREKSGKPAAASALATFPSSDAVDPCATLSRIVSGGCAAPALALQVR